MPEWIGFLELSTLGRLSLALALAATIGLERELSGKPAGLRTNILICVGAELLTELSRSVAMDAAAAGITTTDPSRIAAQIVSGIGFIGAGTIIVLRGHVVGLTTAATIWVVSAIGMTVGLRQYVVAVGATLLVLLTLVALGKLERFIEEPERVTLRVAVTPGSARAPRLTDLLSRHEYRARYVGFARDGETETHTWRVSGQPDRQAELIRGLEGIETVRSARLD